MFAIFHFAISRFFLYFGTRLQAFIETIQRRNRNNDGPQWAAEILEIGGPVS